MKSLTIGIVRNGSANDYVLNRITNYISLYGTQPEVDFNINCGQNDFLQEVNELRYRDADPEASAGAISFFEKLTTKLITDLQYIKIDPDDKEPLHIRLVARPLELAQIPFEFALTPGDPAKTPLLTNPDHMICFTRELRQNTAANYKWPSIPRVLFAWAQPTDEVPFAEHREALSSSVQSIVVPRAGIPYPQSDTEAFITEIPHASLDAISQELLRGIADGRPYTHLHILAHGGRMPTNSGYEFCVILCAAGEEKQEDTINGDGLVAALKRGKPTEMPTVITLAVCDSGNIGNTISPSGALVYNLHKAGIPCVIASQFPLTQEGSVIMVKTLYQDLINACDPRVALYKTRLELRKDEHHDWASLVAYARFPEDIDQQLQDAELQVVFLSMKTTIAWVDHVFEHWDGLPGDRKEAALLEVSNRHEQSIQRLSKYLDKDNKSTLESVTSRAEHLGLLGSAYKRKAEYLHRQSASGNINTDELTKASAEALQLAKEFYYRGFDTSIENHWTAMQYLSLKTITEGGHTEDRELWTIIKFMAERDAVHATNPIWAWATLAELYMLKPFIFSAGSDRAETGESLTKAKEYITKITSFAGARYKDEITSTARQFSRYIDWWPAMFPTSFPREIIAMAEGLRAMLLGG